MSSSRCPFDERAERILAGVSGTRSGIASAFTAAALLASAPVVAATHVWNSSVASGNWNVPGNWSAVGVPTSAEPGGTIVQIGGGVRCAGDISSLVVAQAYFTCGGKPGVVLRS